MPKSISAALRFCLSRNRLLTLPSGDILYFPAGNWFNGYRTGRVWQFVLIDNLRIIAWQIVLLALAAIIFVFHPPLYWLCIALLLPAIETVAALARRIWLKSTPAGYSYTGAIQILCDRYPAVYKGGGFIGAPVGRRIPIVTMIFFTICLLMLGGFAAASELIDLYCRFAGKCQTVQNEINYDMISLSAVMLIGALLLVLNIRHEPVSLPFEL